jgi:hypothetical protein
MTDCFGNYLVPGDVVKIACVLPPLKGWSHKMLADVVGQKGKKVSIRLQSDYAKGLKHVMPDSIRKWEPTEGSDHRCRACREPAVGTICLCLSES